MKFGQVLEVLGVRQPRLEAAVPNRGEVGPVLFGVREDDFPRAFRVELDQERAGLAEGARFDRLTWEKGVKT